MISLFACGVCVDTSFFAGFPFAFYWIPVFVLWSLLFGVPVSIAAKQKQEPIPLLPWPYFLLGLGLILCVGILLLKGSLAVPLFFAISLSLYKVAQSQRAMSKYPLVSPGPITRLACRGQKLYLTICLVLIPVAYVRLGLQMHGILPSWQH